MKKMKFVVTVIVPDDCSVTWIRRYMRDAITCWSGQFQPEDSLFGWWRSFTDRKLSIRVVKS